MGSLDELRAWLRPPGERDLRGRALLPGVRGPHSHITALAATLDPVPLGAADSWADIAARLREYQEKRHIGPGGWVVGFGYDHNVLRSAPTRTARP